MTVEDVIAELCKYDLSKTVKRFDVQTQEPDDDITITELDDGSILIW